MTPYIREYNHLDVLKHSVHLQDVSFLSNLIFPTDYAFLITNLFAHYVRSFLKI